MADYGLTPKGPNIKRLDVILEEMHADLSERLGVNTKQNPQSFINHLLTNIADKCAELWEFGEDVYHSFYPSTAEGTSLDNAAQFGGITRETSAKSYYPIHCTGIDGTSLASGTMIASKTNPKTFLSLTEEKQITRSSFNKASVKIVAVGKGDRYTVSINANAYSFTSTNTDAIQILNGLATAITEQGYTVTVDEENELLLIEANEITETNTLILSENLTTDTVTSIITFGTVETGDVLIPEQAITEIVKADAGLLGVVNLCGYVAGNDEESDAGFRKSYADKIFNRSSMMLESIRSAILTNVQGAVSVAPYENDTNETDEYGRPPHTIEIVVEGGDPMEIAKEILNNKAAGIGTFGDTTVNLVGLYGEDIPVRFSRPTTKYIWFRLGITLRNNAELPVNYSDLLKEVVISNIEQLDAGEDVIPQEFMSELYAACPGIVYIDIGLYSSDNENSSPGNYSERSVELYEKQRAYTSTGMIEVEIDG